MMWIKITSNVEAKENANSGVAVGEQLSANCKYDTFVRLFHI